MAAPTLSPLSLDRSAKSSHFFLTVRSVPNDSFTVTSFSGTDHGISRNFQFIVDVTTDSALTPHTVIGNRATIEISWGSTPIYLHGVVADFLHTNDTPNQMAYRAVIASPFHPLTTNVNNRVFVNKSTPEIVEEILVDAGFTTNEFEMKVKDDHPNHEFIVQFGESDFDFISRMMARAGIFFFFVSDEKQSFIRFSDTSSDCEPVPGVEKLLYRPQTGTARTIETAFRLSPRAQLLPGRVMVTDYNYRTPDIQLEAFDQSSATAVAGQEAVFGDHFKDYDQGQKVARIRREALDVQRETIIAETDCRGILPGFLLTISGHNTAELNGEYLVVNITHKADQGAALALGRGVQGATYTNQLEMIKADLPYRTSLPQHHLVLGMFTSRIESTDPEYAYLDDQGRYRLRTDFDRGKAEKCVASHPVRMLQPYSGNRFGMHFPLHGGTEVAVCCVNGDLNRPIILGALPNPSTPSVVTADNRTQNIIRTASGNELRLDDRIRREKIDLFTAGEKNILTLDATENAHKVRLATEEGEMEIYAKKTILIESGDSQHVQVGKDHTVTVENSQRLMTRNKEIELQAATDIRFKAADNIQFDAEQKDIRMRAQRDMVVDVGRNLSMEVRQQDMKVQVASGEFSLKAARDISLLGRGGGPIVVKQAAGNITVSTSGNLTMKAPSVAIYGSSINLKGNSIGGN